MHPWIADFAKERSERARLEQEYYKALEEESEIVENNPDEYIQK